MIVFQSVQVAGFSNVCHSAVKSEIGVGQDVGMSIRFKVCVDPVWVRRNLIDCHARLEASPILMFLSLFRWAGDPISCFSLIRDWSSASRMSRDCLEASLSSVRSDL